MAIKEFGLKSWSDVGEAKATDSGSKKGKDDFMRWENGNNDVRIITNPYQYNYHQFKLEGDSGYGVKLKCPMQNCDLCKLRNEDGKLTYRVLQRWYVGIIDRKTEAPKIFDMSWSVCQQLLKLKNNPRIGDPMKYDINIVVDKNNKANYYTVQNNPALPLSEADVKYKADFDLDTLIRMCTPLTSEQLTERVAQHCAKNKMAVPTPDTVSAPATPAPASSSEEDEEDDDFTFTDAEV